MILAPWRTSVISACIADPFAAGSGSRFVGGGAFTIPVRAQAAGCTGRSHRRAAVSGPSTSTGMRRKLVMLAAILYLATLASSAYAHHSHPYFYDQCKSITIEGRVESVQWKDPHTLIVVKPDEGTAYTVDWAPLSRLTNNRIIGPAKDALVFGARVAVTG